MDIVVHLAAIAHRSHADSGDYARANRVATASLAQGLPPPRDQAPDLHVVDRCAGGLGGRPCRDRTDEPWPITAYDRAKLAAEEEIRRSGVPFTILRPVIVYGPGAKANIALIMRIAALPCRFPSEPSEISARCLSIDNLVQAIMVCLDGPETLNQTFIVCDPRADHVGRNAGHVARGGGAPAAAGSSSAAGGQGDDHGRRAPVALGPDRPGTGGKFGQICRRPAGRLRSRRKPVYAPW